MSNKGPVKVILVDDHTIVRRGLAALLQMEGGYVVVAEAADGKEALRCAAEVTADVMILDLSMPRLNGLETTRRLVRRQPQLRVLLLSMYDDEAFVTQAIQAGAAGFVLKRSMEDELFQALAAIMKGERFISPMLSLAAADLLAEESGNSQLTSREREVLQLIAEGHNTTEIAELLAISPHTATRHRANLMQKLDAHTQAGLIRTAIERGLVVLKKPPLSGPGAEAE
jgi:DNA-binding NarL/FixJ family response regulator